MEAEEEAACWGGLAFREATAFRLFSGNSNSSTCFSNSSNS